MSTERLAIRRESVSWVATDDSVVVLDLQTSHYLSLNESGSVLWKRLDDGATTAQLEESLVAHFGVDPAQAAADVAAFIEALRARDLLHT